jgi:hypothetical protein
MLGSSHSRAAVAALAGVVGYDLLQRRHAILRNFPILGHLRYALEAFGPELRQYIVTSNNEERPFSRDQRRWIYASSEGKPSVFGFGTDDEMEAVESLLIIKHSPFPAPAPATGEPGGAPRYSVPAGKVLGAGHVALPFKLGFARVYSTFAREGLAEDVVFIGSGRLGFPDSALFAFALGCDLVNVGREAMLAIGCIQAQRCHTGRCPTGVTTQSRWLMHGLDPELKPNRASAPRFCADKDMERETALPAPLKAAPLSDPKPADQQASSEMARPRLELGTPRFSEGPNNPFEEADLQDFYW